MAWRATGHRSNPGRTKGGRTGRWAALIVAVAVVGTDGHAADAVAPPATAHVARAGTLEHRVAVLTRALGLDTRQQAELRRIFTSQREAVNKIWSDPGMLPAERVPATRALEDRTADQIRGILNDEQKKKYNPPKPPQAPGSKPPDVGAWMEASRAR